MILCFKSTCKSQNHLFIIYSSCDRMFDISKKRQGIKREGVPGFEFQ